MYLHEGFDYPLSRLDPFGDHIDPPSVAIYETLVLKGPDGEPHPGLAESWELSEDHLTWTFHLRPKAIFHSGDPCDAPAVVAALERLRWGFHGGNQLWYWDPVDDVKANGEDRVIFTVHHPYVRLPSLLWGTHTAIYNEQRRASDPDGSGYRWADGTGPFRFISYSAQRVEAERFLGYPGSNAAFLATSGPAPLDRIVWSAMLSPKERVAALEQGEVHCIHGPEYVDVHRLEEDTRFNVVRFSQASNAYLGLNWERTDLGFEDIQVRRAISLAIDRPALVRDALLGYGAPTFGPLSPGGEFYDPSVEHGGGHHPDRSARLLEESGWLMAGDGLRSKDGRPFAFECVIQDDSIHRKIAEGVRDQLRGLGIAVELRPIRTFKAFYAACREGPASFINKWLWQDPVDAAIGFTASWGRPTPNWQNASVPELDDAYRDWLRAETADDLQRQASRAQHLVAEHLPYIPLLVPQDVWVHHRSVRDWNPAQAILYPFYHRASVAEPEIA